MDTTVYAFFPAIVLACLGLMLQIGCYTSTRRFARRIVLFFNTQNKDGDAHLKLHGLPWYTWVCKFLRDNNGRNMGIERWEVVVVLDRQLFTWPSYLFLQKLSVMAPLAGVVATAFGFYAIGDIQEWGDLSDSFRTLWPLFVGVMAGALLALFNQLALHSCGLALEDARLSAEEWFDTVVLPEIRIARDTNLESLTASIKHTALTLTNSADAYKNAGDLVNNTLRNFTTSIVELTDNVGVITKNINTYGETALKLDQTSRNTSDAFMAALRALTTDFAHATKHFAVAGKASSKAAHQYELVQHNQAIASEQMSKSAEKLTAGIENSLTPTLNRLFERVENDSLLHTEIQSAASTVSKIVEGMKKNAQSLEIMANTGEREADALHQIGPAIRSIMEELSNTATISIKTFKIAAERAQAIMTTMAIPADQMRAYADTLTKLSDSHQHSIEAVSSLSSRLDRALKDIEQKAAEQGESVIPGALIKLGDQITTQLSLVRDSLLKRDDLAALQLTLNQLNTQQSAATESVARLESGVVEVLREIARSSSDIDATKPSSSSMQIVSLIEKMIHREDALLDAIRQMETMFVNAIVDISEKAKATKWWR